MGYARHMPPRSKTIIATQLPPHLAVRARGLGVRLPDDFRWGVYTRISDDRFGEEKGVGRQDDDCTFAVTEHRGGYVAQRYPENDTSAYKKRKIKLLDPDGYAYDAYRVIRPWFQQAMRDLRDGVIDGLMIYDLDRLARDPRDLEDCIEVVENHHRLVDGYLEGKMNLTTDDGCTMARVLVAMKNQASRDSARRAGRKHWEDAKDGKAVGVAPWGWLPTQKDLHPDNSVILKEMVRLAIEENKSPVQLCRWLAEQEIPPPRSSKRGWHRTTVEWMLRNPRLCGYRTYKKQIMTSKEGVPVTGLWTPLITPEVFEELQDKVGAKAARPNTRGSARHGRKYQFSGYLKCGKILADGTMCLSRMGGYAPASDRKNRSHRYGCAARGNGGCGGCGIDGERTDAVLSELVIQAIERRSLQVRTDAAPFPKAGKLARAQEQQRGLNAQFTAGDWEGTMAQFYELVNGLAESIATLKAEQTAWNAAAMVTPEEGASARKRWEEGDIDARSAMIDKVFTDFIVRPVGRGTSVFDPNRIEPVELTFA